MNFFKSIILVIVLIIRAIGAQDVCTTPPRAYVANRTRSGSDSEESPVTPPRRTLEHTGLTNKVNRILFSSPTMGLLVEGSPAKRSLSDDEWSDDENANCSLNESFDEDFLKNPQFSPSPKKLKKSEPDIAALNMSELKKVYGELIEILGFNSDRYSTLDEKKLLAIKNRADQLGDSTFIQLPIFSFEHISGHDCEGGYHKESPTTRVEVLIKNNTTGAYGGLFPSRNRTSGLKFSSFFPRDMEMPEIISIVHQAYGNIIARHSNKCLSQTNKGPIEMTMSGGMVGEIKATSVYPVLEYKDLTAPYERGREQDRISIEIKDGAISSQKTFTRRQLILAARKSNKPVYTLMHGQAKIFDIAGVLTKNPAARSVYVKIADTDIDYSDCATDVRD